MEENLTESKENTTIQVATAETMATENTVFFIRLSILSPAEEMR